MASDKQQSTRLLEKDLEFWRVHANWPAGLIRAKKPQKLSLRNVIDIRTAPTRPTITILTNDFISDFSICT
jgi:hypothetical protein